MWQGAETYGVEEVFAEETEVLGEEVTAGRGGDGEWSLVDD